jgi:hypothetical protein
LEWVVRPLPEADDVVDETKSKEKAKAVKDAKPAKPAKASKPDKKK